jgi:hypothetical protein
MIAKMKTLKLVLPLLIAGITFNLSTTRAQGVAPDLTPTFEYFTLKSRGNDTLQYLKKNYGPQGLRYNDKTLELLVNDLPFKSCWTFLINNGTLVKFVFFTDPVEKVKEKIKKRLPLWSVHAVILTGLSPQVKKQENLELYRKIEIYGFHKILPLDKQLYHLIKNIKVEFTYLEYDEDFGEETIVE